MYRERNTLSKVILYITVIERWKGRTIKYETGLFIASSLEENFNQVGSKCSCQLTSFQKL